MDFWKPKTLEELAAEQGIHAIKHLEEVLGQGVKLWQDDAEFEKFLAESGIISRKQLPQGGETPWN
jgi:hypothetical protein